MANTYVPLFEDFEEMMAPKKAGLFSEYWMGMHDMEIAIEEFCRENLPECDQNCREKIINFARDYVETHTDENA